MTRIDIREYEISDLDRICELFYDTVHRVNAADYTPEQLEVWADGTPDKARWNKEFTERKALVAEIDGKLAGFADMDTTGYLDRLYVAADCVRKGVGRALLTALEAQNPAAVYTTYASITAVSFFLSEGYAVVRENTVTRHGVTMKNYFMKKIKPAD